MVQPSHPLKGVFLILLASVAFALMGACVKAVTGPLPTLEIVWFRSVIGLVIFIPWMLARKISFKGRHPVFLSLRGLSGFAAIVCYFFALRHLTLATAVVLNYTSPVFVMLLAIPFLKERVSWDIVLLFIISFVGVLCLARPDFLAQSGPFASGLASGFFAAVAYVTISYLGRFENPITVIFHFVLWTGALSTPFLLKQFQMPGGLDWLFLIGAGFFASIGQVWMTQAYFCGSASIISIFSSVAPLMAYLLGVLFWQEKLSPLMNLGIFLIVVGNALLSVRYQKTQSA
ncbi:MAG: DMT family transporter [Candidatus Omnitrophota bacterium]